VIDPDSLRSAFPILAAALGGAAVGVERQRSGHATGPSAHFGGVRTFTLLGGLAGLAGWLAQRGWMFPAAVLIAAAAALVVVGYVAASRHDVDGTTEVAALVVLAAGVVAGLGWLELASAIIAITWLLLVEKSSLHGAIARLDDADLRAGARFAVMAVVILPLLPEGPFGPWGGVRPRALWLLVLLFAGLSFAGFVARRAVGPTHGYRISGLLGGLVSSTSVTLGFARASRDDPALGPALAQGVIAACAVMFVRTLVASAILRPELARAAFPYLAVPAVAGAGLALAGRGTAGGARAAPPAGPAHPLQFRGSLQMAVLFQAVLFLVYGIRQVWGDAGLFGTSAILGLTDVDALTVALSASVGDGTPTRIAARALGLGALVNTLAKLGLTLAIGRGAFRGRAGLPLALLAIAGAAALLVW
jgi:uncharacterized membrane protein (DUF4010 family)